MILAGTAFRPSSFSFKTPVAALIAALMLSACVETGQPGSGAPPAESLAQQPEVVTDPGIYAARSDGQYTVPGLPVDQIPETHRRQLVDYQTDQPAGTIIIDPSTKLLYYVMGKGKALRYGISVGAEGFQWSGEAIVSRKGQWPKWYPPKEMIARKPSLEKWKDGQPGGPTNPLGSRAIYLTSNGVDYGYRIHGTPEWKTIGRNASSGCFRMIQQDVMDLYERVQGGEKVIVLTAKGEMPNGLNIPKPPAPKKAKVAPKPEAAAVVPTPELTLAPPPAALGGTAADSAAPDAAPALSLPTVAPTITAPGMTVTTPEAPAATPAVTPAVPPAAPAAPVVTPAAPAPAVTPAPAAPAATLPAVPSTPICAVPLVDGKCPG